MGAFARLLSNGKTVSFPTNDRQIRLQLMFVMGMFHPTTMLRSSVLRSTNVRYNELYSPGEDSKLWLDLISHTKFANLEDILIFYRDSENTTARSLHTLQAVWLALIKYNQTNHSELFELAKQHTKKITRIRILGISLIKIIEHFDKKTILLFSRLPIYTVKTHRMF